MWLVDRFWAWENRRHDPAAAVRCKVCGREVTRAESVHGACSNDCQDTWVDRNAW